MYFIYLISKFSIKMTESEPYETPIPSGISQADNS